MRIHANAKINWSLDITGQREDGYHLLDMLMQPVTLYDEITLTPSDTLSLTCSGTPYLPPDEHHLALRAARKLQQVTGCSEGSAIHVCKHIPMGAGMGGGSADAAAVLAGLNRLWELGLSQAQLEEIGLTLGADIPFCLRGGLQRTQGIGEAMVSPCSAPSFPLVVIQPCEGLSTGAVFKAYHARADIPRPDTTAAITALASKDLVSLRGTLRNVLQPVSEDLRSEIRSAIADLSGSGAVIAMMTGSGSAVFGVYGTAAEADAAYGELSARYDCCHRCDTCADSLVFLDD